MDMNGTLESLGSSQGEDGNFRIVFISGVPIGFLVKDAEGNEEYFPYAAPLEAVLDSHPVEGEPSDSAVGNDVGLLLCVFACLWYAEVLAFLERRGQYRGSYADPIANPSLRAVASPGGGGAPQNLSPLRISATTGNGGGKRQPLCAHQKVTIDRKFGAFLPGDFGSASIDGPLAPYKGRRYRKQFSATEREPTVRVRVRLDSSNHVPCSRHEGRQPFHVLTPGASPNVEFQGQGFLVVKFECTPKMCFNRDFFRLLIDVTHDGSTQEYFWDFEFKTYQAPQGPAQEPPAPKRRKM